MIEPHPDELGLAPFAVHDSRARGRRQPEPAHPYRTDFQRDRDRVIHSTAFRRLQAKMQVFLAEGGDHHRTRLTHTLEVAQIARTIARALRLNEDLVEAIGLAHDLGHPPFGHAGEQALKECMHDHGGFEHNRHGLRIVDILEERYPGRPGLNLTYEVRESFAKHGTQTAEFTEFNVDAGPTLEAQLVSIADHIAYNSHDLDDALSAQLIRIEDVKRLELWQQCEHHALEKHPGCAGPQLQLATTKTMIGRAVTDLIDETSRQLHAANVLTLEQVRWHGQPLVAFTEAFRDLFHEVELFLQNHVYDHYRVRRMTSKVRRFVLELFDAYRAEPKQLPPRYQQLAERDGLERAVCDYLAGMTDRFAQDEYLKLFAPFKTV